ncbi:hypothetical protein GCM10023340_38570 [Nocardioides marinquilinus]|uniref:IrrE N-terminal-like domain-containing protein n=1 Tax=Nocardioides marinquilinus TaxID=1210400 RepID=A0ABP9PZU0_9ACTN
MTRDRFDIAASHSADLQLDVVWLDLGPRRRGECRWRDGQVVISPRLTLVEAACTLAHEVGHAAFGDDYSTPAVERRAWEYAASLLVEPWEYAQAERVVGPDPRALALELGVTVQLVEAWRRWWQRRGRLLHHDRA